MKPFNQFIISNYSWDPESLTASFCYSFDNEENFVEKIDFRPLKDVEKLNSKESNEEREREYINKVKKLIEYDEERNKVKSSSSNITPSN